MQLRKVQYLEQYYIQNNIAFLLYLTHFIQTLYLKNNKWLPDSINLRLFSGNLYLLSLQIVKCILICNKGMNKVVVDSEVSLSWVLEELEEGLACTV